MERDFESFEKFKERFSTTAVKLFVQAGHGWHKTRRAN
ncbi:hypothetical protein [Sinomicrobium sp. M5D2P17]